MGMIIVYTLATLYALWVLACWLSPFLFAAKAVKLRVPLELPWHMQEQLDKMGVRLYFVPNLVGPDGKYGYGVSVWLGFRRATFLSAEVINFSTQQAKEFLVAHELGHHALGHVTARLFLHIFCLHKLRECRRWMQLSEHWADRYAKQLSGHQPSVLWGPIAASEVGDYPAPHTDPGVRKL